MRGTLGDASAQALAALKAVVVAQGSQINTAQTAATNAQAAATTAATAASNAQTAGQNAGTAASNLAAAVQTGNDAHALINARIDNLTIGTGRIGAALIVGGSVDITVTFASPLPKTNYAVKVAPTVGMTFGTAKTKTTTTCVIPVTATIALVVGQTFTVLAIA